jgi:hypothetical protein
MVWTTPMTSLSSSSVSLSSSSVSKRKHFDEETQYYADEEDCWKKPRNEPYMATSNQNVPNQEYSSTINGSLCVKYTLHQDSNCTMGACTSSTHGFRQHLGSEPETSCFSTMEFYEDESTNMTDNSQFHSIHVTPESSRIELKRNTTNRESWIFSNSREQRRHLPKTSTVA